MHPWHDVYVDDTLIEHAFPDNLLSQPASQPLFLKAPVAKNGGLTKDSLL